MNATIFDSTLTYVPHGWNDRIHFFKYMSASTAKLVLKNRTLRYSRPNLLNDPFDIQFNMEIKANPADVKALALEKLWRVYDEQIVSDSNNILGILIRALRHQIPVMSHDNFVREFSSSFDDGFANMLATLPSVHRDARNLIQRSKILCLTIRPDNVLMWSHYSDNHKGVVLRFRSIPAFDTPYGLAKPIRYIDSVPPLLDAEQLAGIFSGTLSIQDAGILDRTVYTKFTAWSYEQEWRLSAGQGREPDRDFEDCLFGRNDIDGIIFGLRTSQADKDELISLTSRYPNISIMNASRSMSDFILNIEEIAPI